MWVVVRYREGMAGRIVAGPFSAFARADQWMSRLVGKHDDWDLEVEAWDA